MKIKKEIAEVTTFHDIFIEYEGGKVFRYGNDIYMTLEKDYLTSSTTSFNSYNAVDLESGKLTHFNDREEVELLDAELMVKSCI